MSMSMKGKRLYTDPEWRDEIRLVSHY